MVEIMFVYAKILTHNSKSDIQKKLKDLGFVSLITEIFDFIHAFLTQESDYED